jgi:hypothetical protein
MDITRDDSQTNHAEKNRDNHEWWCVADKTKVASWHILHRAEVMQNG